MDEALKIHGHIDVIINMPIITKGSRFLSSKNINDWKKEQAVNFDSLFIINQIAIKSMKKKTLKRLNFWSQCLKSEKDQFPLKRG